MENFSPRKNVFDCPTCGAVKVGMLTHQTVDGPVVPASESEQKQVPSSIVVNYVHWHYVVRCNNCNEQAYIYARRPNYSSENKRAIGPTNMAQMMNRRGTDDYQVVATWPIKNRFAITPHAPKLVREPFEQAARAQSVNAPLAAAGAIRKAVYELCNEQDVPGSDYGEKVRALPIDQSLKTALLAVKDVSDESLHADDWGYRLVELAIKAFSIVCNRIYQDQEELKEFVNEYSSSKQKAGKSPKAVKQHAETTPIA